MSYLTPEQAARVRIVKLTEPETIPFFVRVIQGPNDLAEAIERRERGVTVWAYDPQWGELQRLFNRKATKQLRRRNALGIHSLYYDPEGSESKSPVNRDAGSPKRVLRDRSSAAFIARCHILSLAFSQSLGVYRRKLSFKVDHGHDDHEVHQDSIHEWDLRGTLAMEEGSTLFVNPKDCMSRGMRLRKEIFTNPAASELIDAGVPFYGFEFGVIPFFGSGSLGGQAADFARLACRPPDA